MTVTLSALIWQTAELIEMQMDRWWQHPFGAVVFWNTFILLIAKGNMERPFYQMVAGRANTMVVAELPAQNHRQEFTLQKTIKIVLLQKFNTCLSFWEMYMEMAWIQVAWSKKDVFLPIHADLPVVCQ